MKSVLMAILMIATIGGTAKAQNWELCALEDETCYLPYPTNIRYGANGVFVDSHAGGPFHCSHTEFGDPLRGVRKYCEFQVIQRKPRWTTCAREGQFCRFAGTKAVRYGADGVFATKRERASIYCSHEVFGDPQRGVHKHCEIQR